MNDIKLYGLIGFPLSHSFSQKYFRSKFKKGNIEKSDYLNFEISNIDELPNLLKKHKNLIGFNVTIPFKTQIIKYLDNIDKHADRIGAVNTVKILRKGNSVSLMGYNTDVYGFGESLKDKLEIIHTNALVLGTGGASKAVVNALKKIGITPLIVSRNPLVKNKEISYDIITKDIIQKNKIIINTTPLGMYPNLNELPKIPYQFLSSNHILYDLIYNPPLTKFLLEGKKYDATIVNGKRMLELQAEKSWNIFIS